MSALKVCPTCGSEYPANERFCPRDGTALRTQGGATGDLVGSVIAERYHVLRKLGEGGMGQVYLAEHVKMGRKSAVKVMNPGMIHDADAISRFNREASNASRISHPNVAGIYDFGETNDGLIYLAMEYVEGPSLTSVVESEGALAPKRAAEITRQAAEALAVAHDLGIVHRDLKPDNVMLAKNRDGSDCVKVVDFGIAKAANSDAQKVTKTGLVVGTPEYMSPEQLAGDKLDGRSDIYSLALVTFNMLTGQLPFPSETAQEAMIMRLTERPKMLREMRPDVSWPAEVQAVMDRALERDAKLRYQHASEFGNALSAAVRAMPDDVANAGSARTQVMQGGGAVPATRLGAEAPVKRSRRTPILIGSGVVAAAVLVGAFAMSRNGGATRTPGVAAAPASVVRHDSAATPGPAATSPAPAAPEERHATEPTRTPSTDRDLDARLPRLLEESTNDATAQRALTELDALAPRASTTRERKGIALGRAQALGMLGRQTESCAALNSVRGIGSGTPYDATIAQLLKLSC